MTGFIIVGRGLAASVIAHTLYQNNISFKIIGNENLSNCSKVAAGIWNPVVFKRMTKSWMADEIILTLNKFYIACEELTATNLITQRNIIKPFVEEQEKMLWQKKVNAELNDFLDPTIYNKNNSGFENCKITADYGLVKQCGNLNVAAFLNATTSFFKEHIIDETFDHQQLNVKDTTVSYKTIQAENIIFCEGYLVKNNPFFKWIPLKPAKGETLIVSAPQVKLNNHIFNKNGFLMPLGNGVFKLGATYEWAELTDEPSQKGLTELQDKLTHMINGAYAIQSHGAGIRPSSIDRRPILGAHPKHKNIYIFNGLGTKGVMLAPYFAKKFVNFYLQKEELATEVDVKRFYSMYAG